MWFRRKRKVDPDSALNETLRSLQGLLEEDELNAKSVAGAGPEATVESMEISDLTPDPAPKSVNKPPGMDLNIDLAAIDEPNPEHISIQTSLDSADAAGNGYSDIAQSMFDDIPVLRNSLDGPLESPLENSLGRPFEPATQSKQAFEDDPIAADTDGSGLGATQAITNSGETFGGGEETAATMDHIPVLRTVIFEPESDPESNPGLEQAPPPSAAESASRGGPSAQPIAPIPTTTSIPAPPTTASTALLPSETEAWINQVVDNYNLRLRIADARAMDSKQERELRETLADIMLDRITNL